MPDTAHGYGYGMHGSQDRLDSLRPSAIPSDSARQSQRGVRIEVLVGLIVVVVGAMLALGLLMNRHSQPGSAQNPTTQAPVEVQAPGDDLLDGEGLISLAVERGDFPPELREGDLVRVVLTPGDDGQGGFREVGRQVEVTAVDNSDDSSGKTIVTVRGPVDTAVAFASSGPIHLTIVARGGAS